MLNRRNRIGESGKIETLAKTGSVFKSEFLLFRYAKIDQSLSTFAVNVSKRIDNRSVVRNRLRRQISEALRLNLALLPNGFRVLISARPSLCGQKPEFRVLNQAVNAFFNTLKNHAK